VDHKAEQHKVITFVQICV